MTTIEKLAELDNAAENAGGYVIPPWEIESNPEAELQFSRLRRKSVETGVPMTEIDTTNI